MNQIYRAMLTAMVAEARTDKRKGTMDEMEDMQGVEPWLIYRDVAYDVAMNLLSGGSIVSRGAWPKGKAIWMMRGSSMRVNDRFTDPVVIAIAKRNNDYVRFADHIRMVDQHDVVTSGWVPSQEDMFARDWYVVPPSLYNLV